MTRKYFRYEDTHRKVNGRKQKYCIKCHEWKFEREFGKDRSSMDGLDMLCRDCAKLYAQDLHRIATRKRKVTPYIRFKDRHRIVNRVKQKLCTTCGEWKELNEYYKNSAARDGLMGRCKECTYNLTSKKKLKVKRQKAKKTEFRTQETEYRRLPRCTRNDGVQNKSNQVKSQKAS